VEKLYAMGFGDFLFGGRAGKNVRIWEGMVMFFGDWG
jgi:hypothetical protein